MFVIQASLIVILLLLKSDLIGDSRGDDIKPDCGRVRCLSKVQDIIVLTVSVPLPHILCVLIVKMAKIIQSHRKGGKNEEEEKEKYPTPMTSIRTMRSCSPPGVSRNGEKVY